LIQSAVSSLFGKDGAKEFRKRIEELLDGAS
jgi:hypothetical protein